MRKVIYRYWIFPDRVEGIVKPGTGCFSDQKSGYFHGWGFETHEDANSIVMNSVAIVEDITTGHVYKVDHKRLRFVQPPETRTHSKDTAKVEIVNAELLGKKVLNLLLPVLEAINKKLDTL